VLIGKFGCAISVSVEFSSRLKDADSLICFICQTVWHGIIKTWCTGELPTDWSLFSTQLWVNASVPMAAVAYNELYTHKTQQFPDKAFPWCNTILVKQKWHLCHQSGSYGIHPDGNNCWLQCLGLLKCILGSSPLSFPLCGAVGSYKDVFHRTTALVSQWPNSQPSVGLNGMIRKKLFILKL